MKTVLRRLIVFAIVAALGAGALLLARSFRAQYRDEISEKALELLPDVAQRIQDFHRVKVVGGRKVWEVSAHEAQYFEQEKMVLVEKPVVSLFTRDQKEVALRSSEGRVFVTDRELQRIDLSGDIEVRFEQYVLNATYAQYERESDTIIAPGPVTISGGEIEVHGEDMRIDLERQRLTLERKVRMRVQPPQS